MNVLPSTQASATQNLIISTDLGIDDIMAIFRIACATNISLKGIAICGNGLTHIGPGFHHIRHLLNITGKENVQIGLGRETPLAGNHTFPEAWRLETDQLFEDNTIYQATTDQPSAANLIRDTLIQSAEKVTILALGPLTDLAEALRGQPTEITQKIKMIYIMGGAFKVDGNLAPETAPNNKAAEYNIYVDPAAAFEVLHSQIPLTFIPLDATNQVPFNMKIYERLKTEANTPSGQCLLSLLEKVKHFIETDSFFFWDDVAAEVVRDETVATIEEANIEIVCEEGPYCGQTRICDKGIKVRYTTSIQTERFLDRFFANFRAPSY